MKFVGIILGLLALAKVAGIAVLLLQEDGSKETIWFIKQIVYAVSLGACAFFILFSRRSNQL